MELTTAKTLLLQAEKQGLSLEEFLSELKQVVLKKFTVKVIAKELGKSVSKIRQIIDEELVREKELSNGDTLCGYKGSDITKVTKELFKINDIVDTLVEKIGEKEEKNTEDRQTINI